MPIRRTGKYDLQNRTLAFGKNIVRFARLVPKNPITAPLISQLVRSGTSIGANYHEADDAESKNDFKHKIAISKKEAHETMYWLELIGSSEPTAKNEADILRQEAKELNLIFNAIIRSTNANLANNPTLY